MGKYMVEFDIGDRIENEENTVVEILKKYKNNNVKFRVVENPYSFASDLEVGKVYYINSIPYDNAIDGSNWQLVEEKNPIISSASIKELEKNIQKEENSLNEFVETTRKNISEMKSNLEKLKKTANKIPTIQVGEMYSWEENDFATICVRYEPSDESWCMVFVDNENFDYVWIYTYEFEEGAITNFTHLNSPEQKKIAAGFYAFYTGDIPGV